MGTKKQHRAAPVPIRAVAHDEASAAVAEVDGDAITLAGATPLWAAELLLDGGDEGGTATVHLFRRTAAGWEHRATGSLDGLCGVEPLPKALAKVLPIRGAIALDADDFDPEPSALALLPVAA